MGSSGVSDSTTNTMQQNSSALAALAQQEQQQGQQLFGASFPGFQKAEGFYNTLATGDPYAISRAIQPAAEKVSEATAGSINNIMQNAPAGGEKNLAIEGALVGQGQKVGDLASNAFLGSFGNLASLGGQGIGQGLGATSTAVSGYGASSQGEAQVANIQAQEKSQQLGAFGSLLNVGSHLGGIALA